MRNHFNISCLAKCMSFNCITTLLTIYIFKSRFISSCSSASSEHSSSNAMITTATLFSQISSPEPRPRPSLNSDLQAAATTALPSAIEKAASSSKSKATTTSKTSAGGLKSTSTGGMSPNSSSCPQVSTSITNQ